MEGTVILMIATAELWHIQHQNTTTKCLIPESAESEHHKYRAQVREGQQQDHLLRLSCGLGVNYTGILMSGS